jgi:hypothetical protein
MISIPKFSVGDTLEMKKNHPCGAKTFRVLRTGTDVRIQCTGCGRDVTVERLKLEKSIKKIIPSEVCDAK